MMLEAIILLILIVLVYYLTECPIITGLSAGVGVCAFILYRNKSTNVSGGNDDIQKEDAPEALESVYKILDWNALYNDYASNREYNSDAIQTVLKDPHRHKKQAEIIKKTKADILCLQECAQDLENEIIKAMPQFRSTGLVYHSKMVPPIGQPPIWKESEATIRKLGYEGESIIYDSTKLQLLGTRVHNMTSCVAVIAEFQPLNQEQEHMCKPFFVLNTHMDWEDEARAISMKELDNILHEIDPKVPFIICGDFNTDPNSGTKWKVLEGPNKFNEALNEAATIGGIQDKLKHDEVFIDHIFTRNVDVLDSRIEMEQHRNEKDDPGLTPTGITKNKLLTNLSDHAIVWTLVRICKN
jgi:endonuclease/exonuclease/phosphatase family metal-dependent hydrolase